MHAKFSCKLFKVQEAILIRQGDCGTRHYHSTESVENTCLLFKGKKKLKMSQNWKINGGRDTDFQNAKILPAITKCWQNKTKPKVLNHQWDLNSGQMIHEWKKKRQEWRTVHNNAHWIILYSAFWGVVFTTVVIAVCQYKFKNGWWNTRILS